MQLPLICVLMTDPLKTFHEWLDDASRRGVLEPNAMSLATVDAEGNPTVRMVLLKHADADGFVFYTNLESPKADAIGAHPRAALCFYWNPPGRQVRVEGRVEPVTTEDADAYFASRPYLSRIGVWSSKQSKPLKGSAELDQAVETNMVRFPRGKVPRPSHWSGFRVVADSIELWQEKPFHMHERVLFKTKPKSGWTKAKLYP